MFLSSGSVHDYFFCIIRRNVVGAIQKGTFSAPRPVEYLRRPGRNRNKIVHHPSAPVITSINKVENSTFSFISYPRNGCTSATDLSVNLGSQTMCVIPEGKNPINGFSRRNSLWPPHVIYFQQIKKNNGNLILGYYSFITIILYTFVSIDIVSVHPCLFVHIDIFFFQ